MEPSDATGSQVDQGYTSVLGGHVQQCDSCGRREVSYNSFRNRHCPQCQGSQQAAWFATRSAELLPVPYFHLVFTLPRELAALALVNPRVLYGLLFRTASETLQQVAANPQHLGAQIGGLFVLHTWGQNLEPPRLITGIFAPNFTCCFLAANLQILRRLPGNRAAG